MVRLRWYMPHTVCVCVCVVSGVVSRARAACQHAWRRMRASGSEREASAHGDGVRATRASTPERRASPTLDDAESAQYDRGAARAGARFALLQPLFAQLPTTTR